MLYLSDAIRGEYVQDEFNVIEAPCGCGKTEYAVNKLPYEILGSKPQFNKVLYLIDTCAGRHSIVAKHPEKARCYDNIIDNGGRRFDGFDANRIVVITYAKLGVEVRRNPDFLRQFDLIIADEFHNIHWPIPYERGIIKTDAGACFQGFIDIGKISGGHSICFFIIISQICSSITDLNTCYF